MEHTPTPWKAYQNALGIWSISTEFDLIGQIGRYYDAEHIVKCVNSHDILVEALKAVDDYLSAPYPENMKLKQIAANKLVSALAEVEGK